MTLTCPWGHDTLILRPITGYAYCQRCREPWNLTVCNGNRVSPGEPERGARCEGCDRIHGHYTELERFTKNRYEWVKIRCDWCEYVHEFPVPGQVNA